MMPLPPHILVHRLLGSCSWKFYCSLGINLSSILHIGANVRSASFLTPHFAVLAFFMDLIGVDKRNEFCFSMKYISFINCFSLYFSFRLSCLLQFSLPLTIVSFSTFYNIFIALLCHRSCYSVHSGRSRLQFHKK